MRTENIVRNLMPILKSKPVSISTVPVSPADDRRERMMKYSLAMGVRMVCIFACFFVQGWWLLIPALGAILLPYFAVIVANETGNRSRSIGETPGGVLVVRS